MTYQCLQNLATFSSKSPKVIIMLFLFYHLYHYYTQSNCFLSYVKFCFSYNISVSSLNFFGVIIKENLRKKWFSL